MKTTIKTAQNWLLKRSSQIMLVASISFCLLYFSSIPPSYQEDVPSYTVDVGHGKTAVIQIPPDKLLFQPEENIVGQGEGQALAVYFDKKPSLENLYHQIGNYGTQKRTVFVYPIFTQAAYGDYGFYFYYNGSCGSQCLTVPLPNKIDASYSASAKGANILSLLNYSFITDIDIDRNPDILKNYDRVIMLHNEYVTKAEFDAITHHPDVIFLYPNALYAQVNVNYDSGTITLVRGHGYPTSDIKNGFGWQYDSPKYEYDYNCTHWTYYHKGNHTFLNCYPEYTVLADSELLHDLKNNDPANLSDNISAWLAYPRKANSSSNMLEKFDIQGNNVPSWVRKPAMWTLNGTVSRYEFGDLLQYLSTNKIIF